MAATNESGLEPARHDFPEVGAQEQKGHSASQDYPEIVTQQHNHQYPSQSYDSPQVRPEQHYPIPPSMSGGQTTASLYSPPTQAEKTQGAVAVASPFRTPSSRPPSVDKRNRTVFGCTTTVFILSCIIALLSAAVISLSAATAIEAKRANDNASRLAAFESSSLKGSPVTESLSTRPSSTRSSTDGSSGSESSETKPSATGAPPVTVTTTVTGTPSATSSSLVDDGCSTDPNNVNKSTYTSYPVVGEKTFTRYCNKDSKGTTVLVLFTASFSSCMDACGAYSSMMPKTFGTTGTNATCAGVSFIPEWVSKEAALKTNSRGNCFLKAGPQNESHLSTPGKVTVHVAMVTS